MDENFFINDEKTEDENDHAPDNELNMVQESKEDNDAKEKKKEKPLLTQIGDLTNIQRNISKCFYYAIVFACIITIAGGVYTIADLINPTGKWAFFF